MSKKNNEKYQIAHEEEAKTSGNNVKLYRVALLGADPLDANSTTDIETHLLPRSSEKAFYCPFQPLPSSN